MRAALAHQIDSLPARQANRTIAKKAVAGNDEGQRRAAAVNMSNFTIQQQQDSLSSSVAL